MRRLVVIVLGAILVSLPAAAQVQPFPSTVRGHEIKTNGTTIRVRVGGKGPVVVLLHGYGETGDMWAPLAAVPVRDHTVVVPDLRRLGLSSRPAGGYDKKTQAGDIAGVLDALKIAKADLGDDGACLKLRERMPSSPFAAAGTRQLGAIARSALDRVARSSTPHSPPSNPHSTSCTAPLIQPRGFLP